MSKNANSLICTNTCRELYHWCEKNVSQNFIEMMIISKNKHQNVSTPQ